MDKKRPHDIADLRRQRESIRRVSIGALVVAVVFILASCDALTRRDAGRPAPAAASRLTAQQLVLRTAAPQSDRPREPSLLDSSHGLHSPCRAGHAGTAGMTNHPCKS
jgi:hypothetical protein